MLLLNPPLASLLAQSTPLLLLTYMLPPALAANSFVPSLDIATDATAKLASAGIFVQEAPDVVLNQTPVAPVPAFLVAMRVLPSAEAATDWNQVTARLDQVTPVLVLNQTGPLRSAATHIEVLLEHARLGPDTPLDGKLPDCRATHVTPASALV